MTYIIDGKAIATRRQIQLQKKLKGLNITPKVVSILVGDDPPSVLYTEIKRKKAAELGIDFQPLRFPEDTQFQSVFESIQKLNQDPTVTGIMIQLPLPEAFLTGHTEHELLEQIEPKKDIDGLTLKGDFLCAAVAAVLTILEEESIVIRSKKVVVLGASDLVGKPVGIELACRGANVQICDKDTPNVPEKTRQADILISATGQPHLVTGDMVKEGVVVIDVGAEKVEGKVLGDVDFDSVAPKAAKITPVPGGVGPVTVISLMENVIAAAISY